MEIYAITRGNHFCALTVSKERAERLKTIYGGQVENFCGKGYSGARPEFQWQPKIIESTKQGRVIMRSLFVAIVLMSLLLVWSVNELKQRALIAAENPAGGPVVQVIPEPEEISLASTRAPTVVMVDSAAAEREAQAMPWANSMECVVTFYDCCKKCCGKTNGITYTGVKAAPYETCAVDPDVIPLGSEVVIDYGDGELHRYNAVDTGSGISGNRIDVCVSSHEEALKLGVKKVTAYWIERVF